MKKLYEFLNINIQSQDSLSHRRLILVNTIIWFTIPIFMFLAYYYIFHTNNYKMAMFDTLAIFLSSYSLYTLRKSKDIDKASKSASTLLMIFIIFYVYSNGNTQFGLIWTIFLPIFSILVNGRKIGLYFSLVFYSIIFIMAYNGIGIWENGTWQIESFLRLFFSSLLLTYIVYMNEFALESADKKLIDVRQREQKYIEDLQKQSITDPLTKLYNRRYFHEMTPMLISLAKRKNLILTFFILDIDHFKLYNDNYGHIKGDKVLEKVSEILKKHVQRDDDFVFRLGGEEFGGVIISENIQLTKIWVESICKLIEDLKIEHDYSTTSKYITASIGVASVFNDIDMNIDNIYARADKALYLAKEEGKNRVVFNDEHL